MNQKEFIGSRIRKYRKERLGVSADDLGTMLKKPVGGACVRSWETGRTTPDAEALVELCVLFHAEISDFYMKPVSNPKDESGEFITLSDDEWELLGSYRGLDDKSQKVVRDVAEALTDQEDG